MKLSAKLPTSSKAKKVLWSVIGIAVLFVVIICLVELPVWVNQMNFALFSVVVFLLIIALVALLIGRYIAPRKAMRKKASELQSDILPDSFSGSSSVSVYGKLVKCSEVGGDFYDYFISGGKLYFAIGDVDAYGIDAAISSVRVVDLFRTHAGKTTFNPGEIAGRINASVCRWKNSIRVTAIFASLDIATGELCVCNAGHNPLYVLTPSEEASLKHSDAVSPDLGLSPESMFSCSTHQLNHGDMVLLSTDGVSDASNKNKTTYSSYRLQSFLSKRFEEHNDPSSSALSCARVVDDIASDVKKFIKGMSLSDDFAVLAVRWK